MGRKAEEGIGWGLNRLGSEVEAMGKWGVAVGISMGRNVGETIGWGVNRVGI